MQRGLKDDLNLSQWKKECAAAAERERKQEAKIAEWKASELESLKPVKNEIKRRKVCQK